MNRFLLPLIALAIVVSFGQGCTKLPAVSEPTEGSNADDSSVGTPFTGSCAGIETMTGFCYSYTGNAWTKEKAENDCFFQEYMEVRDTPCIQDESTVATCRYALEGKKEREIEYVYGDGFTLTQAKMSCPAGAYFTEVSRP